MLVDGGKGLEPQTRKLFGVAQRSRLPVFTFVNKLDRPAMSPWEILDEIAEEFGLETAVRTFPVGDGERFRGVYDVARDEVWVYAKTARGDKVPPASVFAGGAELARRPRSSASPTRTRRRWPRPSATRSSSRSSPRTAR